MIIEFVGPPGVGKSTVSHGLVERLRQLGIGGELVLLDGYRKPGGEPLSQRQRCWDRVVALACQPPLAVGAAACLAREGTGTALSWMINVARRNRAMRSLRDRRDVFVLEEGRLSALILASCSRRRPWTAERYRRWLARPDLVVALTATPDTIHHRVKARAGILGSASRAEVLSLAGRYLTDLDGLLHSARVPSVRYDTERLTIDIIVAKVIDEMGRISQPTR